MYAQDSTLVPVSPVEAEFQTDIEDCEVRCFGSENAPGPDWHRVCAGYCKLVAFCPPAAAGCQNVFICDGMLMGVIKIF